MPPPRLYEVSSGHKDTTVASIEVVINLHKSHTVLAQLEVQLPSDLLSDQSSSFHMKELI